MKRETSRCISYPFRDVANAPNIIPRKPERKLETGACNMVPEQNVVLGENILRFINILMLTSTSKYSRNSPILQEK